MSDIDSQIIQFVIKKNKLKDPVEAKRFSSGVVNRGHDIGGKYALKIEGDAQFGAPSHEILKPVPDITSKLLAKGAKVPKIVDFGSIDGKNYLLMEKVQGNNLAYDWMSFTDSRREKIIEQLAEQLKIWHSINFDRYSVPIVSEEFFNNLSGAIGRFTVKKMGSIQKDKFPKEFLPNLELLENFYHSHIGELNETGTAVLVHQDIHLENIFYRDDELTGIIDMDWMCQAPKDYELWKILDVVHAPKYTVEEKLEPLYEGYQMTEEFNWLKKYYPELFSTKNLANRLRLYYIDPLMETIIDYQNGRWSNRVLAKVTDKVRDFYQNSWLDDMLN